MNKEIATKWIEALRSGKYKKIVGCLKKVENYEQGSFCALGVLCDIYQKESEEPLAESKRTPTAKKTKVSIDGEFDALPEKVRDWAGLGDSEASIPAIHSTVPILNDRQKLSFKEIADVIEKNFKEM
jgi:hypothetical protein